MKRTPLRKVSKKRVVSLRKYWNLRKKMLVNAFCEFPDCVKRANQIHHIRGRASDKLIDTRYLMLICAEHHQWIHDNSREARKQHLLQ